jgi:hypothetical protein
MRTSILLFALLLSVSVAFAQREFRPMGQRGCESRGPVREDCASSDSATVCPRFDADELVILSQSIHSGIDNVEKGMLPKDLLDKLKQVEKLSKRLRGELTP